MNRVELEDPDDLLQNNIFLSTILRDMPVELSESHSIRNLIQIVRFHNLIINFC